MLKYALLLAVPLLAQEALRGSWGAEFSGDKVHLNIRTSGSNGFSNWGRTIKTSELSDVVRTDDNITFKLARDAGTFIFRGREDGRQNGGVWTFTPNSSYVQQLQKRGYDASDARDLFVFAVCDLSLANVDYLEQNTTDPLTTARFVKLCSHGVTPDYAKALSAAGYKNLDSDEMLQARDHGVSDDYIEEMHGLGYKVALEDLVRTRDHGVDGNFAADVRELGYKGVDIDGLIRLRDHGVTPSYIKRVNRAHGRQLDLAEVIRLRDHGY